MPDRPRWLTQRPRRHAAHQTPQQPAAEVIGRRTRAEVEAEQRRADWHVEHERRTGAREPGGGRSYHEGVADAVRWALGERETAPVTGRYSPPGVPGAAELRAEDNAAYDAIYRQRPNSYQTGVQAALMWVRGETQQRAALGIPDDRP